MRTRVLIVASQTELRAAVARILLPVGFRVEIASSEKTAREVLDKERFGAAIVAPDSVAPTDLAFLRDIQAAVNRLVLLTTDPNASRLLAASFPNALVSPCQPLDAEKLTQFVDGKPASAESSLEDSATTREVVRFEGYTLDVLGRLCLDANRQAVKLTRAEFALLVAFVRNPGRVLTRTQLRNAIDGRSADAYDRSVDMLVARLRRKIEPDAAKAQFIITVPGSGYRFAAAVHDVTADPGAADPPAASGRERSPQPAQRRQLTVLSCQVLGFAALAATSDPEDLEEVIARVHAACAEVITHFGGTTVRALGDSMLGYFGHPRAHENNAERAVRAALELLRTIANVETASPKKFRARIGIATGLMVIGELSAVGAKEPTGVGEALNLALHMQNAAPADSVVIAARTREQIGRFFNCVELAPVVVEEDRTPAAAWRVVDEVAGMLRFDALRRDAMMEFVNRTAETERLSKSWANVRNGLGQVVLLTGEAGIGKSRLVIEFESRLGAEPHFTMRYSGSPHQTETPMAVILDELQRSAGFMPDDSAPQKSQKLQKLFTGLSPEATALVAALLRLPFEPLPEIAQLSPQKRKERIFAALLARVQSMAAQQPVLAVVEDVHWVDPTSLEFLALLVERASTLRLLLVIDGRPEFAPPWHDHSHVVTLALSRLSRSDSSALIYQVAQERPLAAAIEAQILARADGVPLFVEELTKSVLESGVAGNGQMPVRSDQPDAAQSIPTTLQGLLLERFDRLENGKEVAQAGAAIGREFSLELLRLIAGMDERPLTAALEQLVSAGLVFRRGSPTQATYVFKHALARDAAYDMLARPRRRHLHAAIAQALEERFPETVDFQPELLAYHHREAGNAAKAISYLIKASARALSRSAMTETVAQCGGALQLLATLPDEKSYQQLELRVQVNLARALLAIKGPTAPEPAQAYRRARTLCEILDDTATLPFVLIGQWYGNLLGAAHRDAIKQAETLLELGERQSHQTWKTLAHYGIGHCLTELGEFARAQKYLATAIELDQYEWPDGSVATWGRGDARVQSLAYLQHCQFLLGWFEQAEKTAQSTMTCAEKLSDPYARALGLFAICRIHGIQRDPIAVAERAAELLAFADEHGFSLLVARAKIFHGWALALSGEVTRGVELCRSGIVVSRSAGVRSAMPMHLGLYAEALAKAGDRQAALAAYREAAQEIRETEQRFWEAELLRLEGELHAANGVDPERAETCFRDAVEAARRQEARLLELRAATSLGALLARSGKRTQAHDAVAPVFSSLAGKSNSVDLEETKALLDLLR